MTDHALRCGRRRFITASAAGVVAAPLYAGLLVRLAQAQERVSEDSELAQQLGYVHDASTVDPSQWPTYEEGQVCANCQLFEAQEDTEWGPCQIFGGQLVAAQGWCSAWIAAEA